MKFKNSIYLLIEKHTSHPAANNEMYNGSWIIPTPGCEYAILKLIGELLRKLSDIS